jgi:hypothetical protein
MPRYAPRQSEADQRRDKPRRVFDRQISIRSQGYRSTRRGAEHGQQKWMRVSAGVLSLLERSVT